jgi:hypothetical protein
MNEITASEKVSRLATTICLTFNYNQVIIDKTPEETLASIWRYKLNKLFQI